MEEEKPPIVGRPPNPAEKKMYEAYVEDITKQGERMDETLREILKLELAIPGLYMAALRLVAGDIHVLSTSLAFGFWALALVFTLAGIYPRKWKVMDGVVKSHGESEELTIPDYFNTVSRQKHQFLTAATAIFFVGMACAVWSILEGLI